ncbi:PAS domain S-box protein [Leptolyngbya sp. FACHB-541]|uniref:PAS domain-containing sensor histidine kinase n=1 Tax=Leptolyngbya sp. FACHB-541 TaxID=2692810 RepID=UPI00168818A4|nr:PAS domain-containing sensor histidine kinase [Leptolyngbya sp. FACHB-541]MBD2000049.1 PAS domain S-box protein [Leptolyngbya sp. FACHB-541]
MAEETSFYTNRAKAHLGDHLDLSGDEDLSNSQNLSRDIVNCVPVGLIIWHLKNLDDPNSFQLITANSAMGKILEMPLDQLLREAIAAPFPAFLGIEPADFYVEVIRSAQTRSLGEVRYRNRRKIQTVLSLTAFPMPNQCVGVVVGDITEFKQIEAGLQTDRNLFQRIVATTQEGIWLFDVEGKTSYVNQQMGDMLGYSVAEMLGRSLLDFVDDEARTAIAVPFAKQHGLRGQHDLRFRCRTGDSLWAIVSATPMFNEDGKFVSTLVMVTDVTERKQAEVNLTASETLYRRLFESAQDGILVVAPENGSITDANPSLLKLLGYAYQELVGKKLWELGFVSEAEGQQTFQTLIEQGDLRYDNLLLRTRYGRHIEVEFISNVYQAGSRQVIQCNVRDITERRQTEAELRQFTTRLQQSNQELEDFAAIASHDLQEPLRKIQAFGDRLKSQYSQALTPEGQDYLERMQTAARRMQVLINDLLSVSRITTRAKPFVKVNLNEVIQEVLSDLEFQIQRVKAQITVEELPTIDADPPQMRQLLQNLLSNALKFHQPDVPPIVLIRSQIFNSACLDGSNPLQNARCQIIVTDNGIGFAQNYTDRIFTVFQRLHSSSEYEGTGIGLAICRKIAERHGGTITASSVPGQGSTFTIVLPLQQPN